MLQGVESPNSPSERIMSTSPGMGQQVTLIPPEPESDVIQVVVEVKQRRKSIVAVMQGLRVHSGRLERLEPRREVTVFSLEEF
jgi:hypothetical protein